MAATEAGRGSGASAKFPHEYSATGNYFIVDHRHRARKLTRALTRLLLADEQLKVSRDNSQGSMVQEAGFTAK